MKKLFLSLLLCIIVNVAIGQVLIYKAFTGEFTFEQSWDRAAKVDFEKPVFITVNGEKEYIEITNELKDKFFIMNVWGDTTKDGEEGNKYAQQHLLFECIDSNGTKCNVIISYHIDQQIKYGGKYTDRVRVFYNNVWYGYYCITLSAKTKEI